MTMSRFYRSTHKRSDTATYAKTQRRLKFITLFNVDLDINFNIDSNSNLDLDKSNLNFFFANFVFTSFFMRITSSRIHITFFDILYDKKSFNEKDYLATKNYLTTKNYHAEFTKSKTRKKSLMSLISFMIIFMIIF